MPTQQDINAFSDRIKQRDRERMKIVGYTLTVLPLEKVDAVNPLTKQHKLPEVPHGKS